MRELYKEIGEFVREHMEDNGIRVIDLGKILSKSFGITEDSVRSYISAIRNGFLIPNRRYKDEEIDPKSTDLERIALLFQATGVSSYHEIIGKIKKNFHGFIYPPLETEIKGRKEEKLEDYVDRLRPKDKILLTRVAKGIVNSYEKESDNLK